jgi:2-oxoglutarate/2-oxoacid ferredoxin oxidoreductase subunit beta
MADDKPTKKATLPPGTAKPAGPPAGGPKGVKPTGPPPGPQGVKPAGPNAAKPAVVATSPIAVKPAGPRAGKPVSPPSGPQGVKPAGPAAAPKAAVPSGLPAKSKATRPDGPTLPPSAKRPPAPGGDGAPAEGFTRKDFVSGADVRWCPGCGDYAVLAATQRVLPELVERKENVVFISGIGCSSRFPYYMNTYGMHSIHGRAPTVATGLKCANPELDVWIITGDGDSLSIGGNHFVHLLRRNPDVQILLFNNQIYGLTKGQYSPTSEPGKVTKSTPYGSLDHPFNPVALALGADASFVARSMDRDPAHMQAMLRRAHAHEGAALVEIYQNCNIFNDGAFFRFTERESKPQTTLFFEHGRPLVFDGGARGLRLDGFTPTVVDLDGGHHSADDCLVYDETDRTLATIMSRLFWQEDMPQPFGVFYRQERPTYERLLREQQAAVRRKHGAADLRALLSAGETWTIE